MVLRSPGNGGDEMRRGEESGMKSRRVIGNGVLLPCMWVLSGTTGAEKL